MRSGTSLLIFRGRNQQGSGACSSLMPDQLWTRELAERAAAKAAATAEARRAHQELAQLYAVQRQKTLGSHG